MGHEKNYRALKWVALAEVVVIVISLLLILVQFRNIGFNSPIPASFA